MSYTYKLIEGTYVVWFAPANRFMQLQEPAFRLLQDWTNKLPESQIIKKCADEYKLQLSEARRFLMEVTVQLQSLTKSYIQNKIVSHCYESKPLEIEWFTTKIYCINGINFLFRFGDPDLEALINPGFGYLEKKLIESKVNHRFDLYYCGGLAILQIDRQTTWKCPYSSLEYFVGLVYMQMINRIHHLTDANWMGAVHASAVSSGKGAVLFAAPSGCGKSTFTALLMNHGYRVLSDDFSPISLIDAKVYSFPKGISVKNGSLKVLQSNLLSLNKKENALPHHTREIFIPIITGEMLAPVPVNAIVFLQYNPSVEVELKRISNLNSLSRFLQQLWLLPTRKAASGFMEWYFTLPCYTLRYSNSGKAIGCISGLFK